MQPKLYGGLGAAALTALVLAGSLAGGATGGSRTEEASNPQDPGPGVVERFRIEGRLSCAIGTISSSSDLCGEGDKAFVQPALSEPITGVSYLLRWTPSNPALGSKLSFAFTTPQTEHYDVEATGQLDLGSHIVRGGSPIGARFESTANDEPLYVFNPGGTLSTYVRASYVKPSELPDDPTSVDHVGIILDQPYALCITIAYNEAPLPEEDC